MDNQDIKINIEEIMREIRADIERKGLKDDAICFSEIQTSIDEQLTDFDMSLLMKQLECLNSNWEIATYRPIISGRKGIGSVVVFVKKAIRKLIHFYIQPIVDSQNEFNASLVRSTNLIRSYIEGQENYSDRLDQMEFALNKDIKKVLNIYFQNNCNLARENKALAEKVTVLERQQSEGERHVKLLNEKLDLLSIQFERVNCMIQMKGKSGKGEL